MGDLKPGWTRVKFGEIADCVTDRVDDPSTAGVDRYVGLEHLDSESLTIQRWGAPEDVESTKLRFRTGDIIFGKRRAYQRKLAVADFDGICSAHAMVIRARAGKVIPEFLPFFMQSELFMERAVAISVGSLSPTINWKTLESEGFVLPPMETQRRIAILLASAESVRRSYVELQPAAKIAFASALKDRFARHTTFTTLGAVAEVGSGGTPRRGQSDFWNGSIPWVKTGEVNYNLILDTEEQITDAGMKGSAARLWPAGTILMALFGQGPTLGRVATLGTAATTNQACAAIRVREQMHPRFVYFWLVRQYEAIRRLARGAAQPNLNLSIVRALDVPLATLDVQGKIADELNELQAGLDQHARRMCEAAMLCRRLGEQLLTGSN